MAASFEDRFKIPGCGFFVRAVGLQEVTADARIDGILRSQRLLSLRCPLIASDMDDDDDLDDMEALLLFLLREVGESAIDAEEIIAALQRRTSGAPRSRRSPRTPRRS